MTKELNNVAPIILQHVRHKSNSIADKIANEGVLSRFHLYDIDNHSATSLDLWSNYQNIVAKDVTTPDVGSSRRCNVEVVGT